MKISRMLFMFITLNVFLFSITVVNCFGDDRYVGKSMPKDELIKHMYSIGTGGKYRITELIGKHEISENTYQVYYEYNGRNIDNKIILVKLDSNVWMVKVLNDWHIVKNIK